MKTFFKHDTRRPRARSWIAAGALVALTACAVAAADSEFSGASVVSATFYANTLSGTTNSQTCTTSTPTPNTIQVTEATFTGTATSTTDPSLNGPLTIRVRSVYDSTTNAGWLSADFSVANSTATPPAWFDGRLTAVDDNGTVQGLLSGGQGAGVQLLGNVTSSFSSTAGFGSSGSQGTIGSSTTGGATDTAVVSSGFCSTKPQSDQNDQDDQNPPSFSHGFKPLSFGHGSDHDD